MHRDAFTWDKKPRKIPWPLQTFPADCRRNNRIGCQQKPIQQRMQIPTWAFLSLRRISGLLENLGREKLPHRTDQQFGSPSLASTLPCVPHLPFLQGHPRHSPPPLTHALNDFVERRLQGGPFGLGALAHNAHAVVESQGCGAAAVNRGAEGLLPGELSLSPRSGGSGDDLRFLFRHARGLLECRLLARVDDGDRARVSESWTTSDRPCDWAMSPNSEPAKLVLTSIDAPPEVNFAQA